MKYKISILTRIAILFLAALIIASTITYYFSYNYMLKITEQQNKGVANAGHEEPLILSGDPSYLEVMSGLVLGLFEDSDIVEEKLVLRDGDGILLYTDGVTEAINTEKQMYGKDRLRESAQHKN